MTITKRILVLILINSFYLVHKQGAYTPGQSGHSIFWSFLSGIHFRYDSYSLIFIDSWWPQSSHISDTVEHVLSVTCFPFRIVGIFVFIVSATSALEYISVEGISTKGTKLELIEFSFKFFLFLLFNQGSLDYVSKLGMNFVKKILFFV